MRTDGSLHLKDRFVFLRRALLGLSGVFTALAIALAIESTDVRQGIGPLGGALICAALAAVLEDSEFEFDAAVREVRWRKSRLIGRRCGTVSFDGVENVIVEVRSDRSDSGLSKTHDARIFLVVRGERIALGNSNLHPEWAQRVVVLPLLALLGKSTVVEESLEARLSRK
jgi:hypothetical protein